LSALFTSFHEKKNRENHVIFGSLDENLPLKEFLNRLSKIGADVRIVTCDQGTSNQSAYNQLGIDSDRSYFIYNEKKYYAFDFPHLVKRLASLLRRQKKSVL